SFFFSSRRRHTSFSRDWSSDVCSSDLVFADNTEPGYQQKRFARTQAIEPVITPDGRDGTLKIRQDARLLHIRLHNEAAEQPLDRSEERRVGKASGAQVWAGRVKIRYGH